MKKSSLFQAAVVVGLVMASHVAHAADDSSMGEVVVTATRNATPIEQVGSTVYVVTSKEIEQKQKQTVAEVLETIPGVTVYRNGGTGGQLTTAYLRGAAAGHTLVLINGFPVNDPSYPSDEFNFDRLNLDSVDKIEIIQGPQSTLYGSRAIGGVINIITKKSRGNEIILRAEGGSFKTFKEGATISVGSNSIQYVFDISQLNSQGISIAQPNLGNTEKDGFRLTTITSNLSITPDSSTDIDLFVKFQKGSADQDDFSPVSYQLMDSSSFYKTTESTFGIRASKRFLGDRWETQASASENKATRTLPPGDGNTSYKGTNDKFTFLNTLQANPAHKITIGLENSQEKAETSQILEHTVQTNSIFIQDQFSPLQDLTITLGGRLDDHQTFGSHETYRATIAYQIAPKTIIRSSLGTGFKAPSISQLYDNSSYSSGRYHFTGNSLLQPETSKGWDIGLEHQFSLMKAKTNVSFFKNIYKNLITSYLVTPGNYSYTNINKAESQGVECSVNLIPLERLNVSANYTYLMTDNGLGKQLAQRPLNKAMLSAQYELINKLHIGLEGLFTGTRYEYNSSTTKLGSYYIINMTTSYDLRKNIQVYARLNNMLDRRYADFTNYNTPGVAAYAGLKVSF